MARIFAAIMQPFENLEEDYVRQILKRHWLSTGKIIPS